MVVGIFPNAVIIFRILESILIKNTPYSTLCLRATWTYILVALARGSELPQGKAYFCSSSEHIENETLIAVTTTALHYGLNRDLVPER